MFMASLIEKSLEWMSFAALAGACLLGTAMFSVEALGQDQVPVDKNEEKVESGNGNIKPEAGGGAERNGPPVTEAGAQAESKAQDLINRLGDENFIVRRKAYEQLFSMGRPALKPLARALDSEDPEVKTRASELLISMRGRGFLGIHLEEDWEGTRPQDYLRVNGGGVQQLNEDDGDKVEEDDGQPRRDAPPRVRVVKVVEGMPAGKAGIQAEDRILSVNGRPIKGMTDLMREVILAGPMSRILVVVLRDEKKVTLLVRLTRNPQDPLPPVDLLQNSKEAQVEVLIPLNR